MYCFRHCFPVYELIVNVSSFPLFFLSHSVSRLPRRAGKSTLFKQAIALYGAKPTHAEMMQFVPIICNNIIQNIKTLIKYSEELSPPCPVTGGNQQHKALIDEVRADATKLTQAQAAAVKALWADAGIQVRGEDGTIICLDSTLLLHL